MAYGGGNFITYVNQLGSGTNSTAIALFEAGDSFAVYANFFNQLSVTNTSVYDYVAGATVDYEAEEADQMANRKVSIPIHIMYSYYNLVERSGFNVSEIWSNWVAPGIPLTTGPVCCGQGHFIIEEAPQQTVDQLNEFMDSLGVAS
jgi:haloacetate dehalogenase